MGKRRKAWKAGYEFGYSFGYDMAVDDSRKASDQLMLIPSWEMVDAGRKALEAWEGTPKESQECIQAIWMAMAIVMHEQAKAARENDRSKSGA